MIEHIYVAHDIHMNAQWFTYNEHKYNHIQCKNDKGYTNVKIYVGYMNIFVATYENIWEWTCFVYVDYMLRYVILHVILCFMFCGNKILSSAKKTYCIIDTKFTYIYM